MSWEKPPRFTGEISPKALTIPSPGMGFWGGYSFNSDEELKVRDVQKIAAMQKALILRTTDDWKTKSVAFEGEGEIDAFCDVGNGNIIALNSQTSAVTFAETMHFINWDGSDWKNISALPFRVVAVWGSESPCLLAVGYPQQGFEPVFASVSFDGAHSWQRVSLGRVNPALDSLSNNTVLFPNAILYCLSPIGLDRLDLKQSIDSGRWERVRTLPPSFKPLTMARRDDSLIAIGSTFDKGFAVWYMRADGTGGAPLSSCKGIEKNFNPVKLIVINGSLYLVGFKQIFEGGEMCGLEHHILKSRTPAGTDWQDMNLPISGSLEAAAFGGDGRIWAIAAGNRMQVYLGDASAK